MKKYEEQRKHYTMMLENARAHNMPKIIEYCKRKLERIKK